MKSEKRMDGWTFVGEVFACALCGAEIPRADEPASTGRPEQAKQEASSRLADFLGGANVDSKRVDLESKPGEARFCRDCSQYLVHPFVSRCLLHDRDVEPMDDCESFEARGIADDDAPEEDL